MMTNILFENLTAIQLKKKEAAFLELFGREPTIYVRGTLIDKTGNAVFLTSSPAQVKKINKKYMTLWLDFDSEYIVVKVPLFGARYEFSF